MPNSFFDHPILNSPYDYPARYWELDDSGQPTQKIIERRRRAEFITPIPKPKKRKASATQQEMVFDEGKGLSTAAQQYDPTSIINELRRHVDQWRALPHPNQWQVTPETARLLQHWRHHDFGSIRPFKAVRPERDALEIRFPRVEGYRVELPEERLTAEFNDDSVLELTPDLVGATKTQNSGIIGEKVDLNLVHTGDVRPSQVLYELTSHLVLNKWRDAGEDPKLHLFGQLKRIAKQWLDGYLVCKEG